MIAIPPHIMLLLLFTILWVFLFVRSQPTRREMILIGLLGMVFTPVIYLLNADALSATVAPTISVGHFLFSFVFAGCAAVIFQEVLGKRYRTRRTFSLKRHMQDAHWLVTIFILTVTWAWLSVLFVFLLSTTAFQGLVISALFIGMLIVSLRHDLLADAILSAVLMSIVFFLLYEVAFFENGPVISSEWWGVTSLPERFVASVPLEALIWAAATGFILGPLYEYARGLRLSIAKK